MKKLPMKFNAGLKKYEPELPARKTNEKLKVEFDWKWLIFPLLILIVFIIFLIKVA